jgi:hypothetical protein
MSTITPADAREYCDRWSLVNTQEIEELRRMPMEAKLLQLASLMASRALMPADPRREQQVEEVRRRWARLRDLLGD